MSLSETPSLEEILQHCIDRRLIDLHTAIPAAVVSYDSASQRVSVQPLVRASYEDESGEPQTERLPIINDVPVSFVGSGAFSLTWPLAKGDTGMLLVSEVSIARWKQTGTDDPGDDRRFNISDAVFLPGVRNNGHRITSAGVHGTAMVIRAAEIHAGGSDSLAFADDIDALAGRMLAAETAINLIVPFSVTPGPPTYGGTDTLKGG